MDSPATELADTGTPLDPRTATSVLGALQRTTHRAIAVVRPEVVDGRMVDGEVVWLSDMARYYDPRVSAGLKLTAVFGDRLAHEDTGRLGQVALDQPGEPVVYGPFPVPFRENSGFHMEVSVTALDGLLFVE